VRNKVVLCPSNTFMATPLVTLQAGARVEFVDCNRADLCLSLVDLKRKVDELQPAAVWLVHIGGHIAFETEEIATFCRARGIVLLEDCAHAHGAQWHGKRAGAWGDAGVYSYYATKTISTGEGGMLVTRRADLVEYARLYRNYGKPEHVVQGLNHRMSEFVAAIGVVQTRRLPDIIDFKQNLAAKLDTQFPNRVRLPEGMVSGYYKYIVFDEIQESTGKVYDAPCHRVLKHSVELPNTDWVAGHHWCVPIYYQTPSD
jgi:perosamine synthetase